MRIQTWIVIGVGLFLAGCAGGPVEVTPADVENPALTQASSPTPDRPTAPVAPSATSPPASPTSTDRPPTEEPGPLICSPLAETSLADIEGAVTNPFLPPRLGSDDPHQGVDLAYRFAGEGFALAGEPVFAALSGRVVGVIQDRFPYGNALIVETPLDDLDGLNVDWPVSPQVPEASITLTCPEVARDWPETAVLSLYTIYAHMQNPPAQEIGTEVACAGQIGATGDTGNALNPHLHVEMRVGPVGATFESMAHYETRASAIEMANYCVWRVSGEFVLVDLLEVWTDIGSP